MTYASLATGVLLAAGYGSRFDPDGLHNKLLARMPDGGVVAHEAAHRLLLVVTRSRWCGLGQRRSPAC
jgi:molybdenum cofactor cytidylyltransferase